MAPRCSYSGDYFVEALGFYLKDLFWMCYTQKKIRGFYGKGIKNLLIDELHDILNAEEQIVEAVPAMAQAAQSPELKEAFEGHLKETKGQIQRLLKIFKLLKIDRKEKLCKATKICLK